PSACWFGATGAFGNMVVLGCCIRQLTCRGKPPGSESEGIHVVLFEYQARDLFEKHGVPVLKAQVATTPEEAKTAAEALGGGTVVVKSQVKSGGSGKAGGVKVAKNGDEAAARAKIEKHGVTEPRAQVARTPEEAKTAAEALGGGTVVVKSQVKIGGPGKAGGVKVAKNPDEAEARAKDILGLDIKGHITEKVM